MPFGKFEGLRIDEVPDWYLLGIERNHENYFAFVAEEYPEVLEYIRDNMDSLLPDEE